MKNITKIILFILFAGFLSQSKAQIINSATCGVAPTIMTNTFQTISQGSTDGWLSFIAGNNTITFLIKNIFTGTNSGKIVAAKVYAGSCGTFTQVAGDTISPGNDTLLTLSLTGLTLGNNYFIYTQSGNFPLQCNNQNNCSSDAIFDLRPVGALDLCGSGIEYWFDNQVFPNDPFGNPYDNCLSVFPCQSAGPFCQYTICCNNNFAVNIVPSAIQVSIPIYVYCSNGQSYIVNTVPNVAPTTIPFNFGCGLTYTISGNPSINNLPYPGLTYDAGMVVITPVSTPPGNFTLSPNPLCVGGTACLTYTTNNASVLVKYLPNNPVGNSQVTTSNANNFTATFCKTYPFAGLYNYTLTTKLQPDAMDINKKCVLNTPVTVTVNTNLLLTISTLPSNDVCYGKQVTIVASAPGATGYTLLPGGITGNTTPFVVNVTPPLGNTAYTVIAANGCSTSAVVNISTFSVNPFFTVTASENFFCVNQSGNPLITLNVNPGGTYTLQSPTFPFLTSTQFVNSIVVSPSVTTTYTVLGADINGCVSNTVITLTKVPCQCLASTGTTLGGLFPSPVNLTPNVDFKVVSDMTVSVGGSFFFNQNDITVYPGVRIVLQSAVASLGATVNIIGSHLHGCGEMWEGITVSTPNCQLNLVPGNIQGISKTTMIEDAKVAVNLPNTIFPGFTNANINPNMLTVDNVTFNKNISGITISNFSADINSIPLNSLPFTIKNSLFTSRNIPYSINSWPLTNTVKNQASGLSTMETPYINNASYAPVQISSILYGYLGFPSTGINLVNVGFTDLTQSPPVFQNIKIGSSGLNNFNCFDHIITDISAFNSNASVFNSVFQYGIRTGKGNLSGGRGILASSSSTFKNQLIVNGGPGNGNFPCRFYDKTVGVDASDYFDIEVQSAKFFSFLNNYNLFNQGNSFGGEGVNILTSRYQNINIQASEFHNIKNAMMITVDNASNSTGLSREIGQIIVQSNTVDVWVGTIPGGSTPYVNIGTYIADPVNVPASIVFHSPIDVNVVGNKYTKVNNGISIMNFAQSPVVVLSNTISMVNESFLFNSNPVQKAIFGSLNTKFLTIHTNSITGPSFSWGDSLKGIMTVANGSLSVRCNTTANTARAMEFDHVQFTDFFEDNSIIGSTVPNPSNRAFGLVLDHNAVLSGFNTMIGTSSRPTDNLWQEPWPNSGGFKTMTYQSDAKFSRLFIQYFTLPALNPANSANTDIGGGNLCPTEFSYLICNTQLNSTLLNANIIENPTCRISGGHGNGNGNGGGGNAAARALLEDVVSNNITFNNNIPESQHISKTYTYRSLKSNPSIMAGSNVLSNFYVAAQSNNLQNMVSIEESLANNNIGNAQSLISALTPTNNIESNYKAYYQIFKHVKDTTFNSNDSLGLITLANLCPYTDGMVVFQARVLYNRIYGDYFKYTDNCGGNNQQTRLFHNDAVINQVQSANQSFIYPNPNDGGFAVKFRSQNEKESVEICIFDLVGRQVVKENRTIVNGEEFNYGNLTNGTYVLRLKFENGTVDVHKLIINK